MVAFATTWAEDRATVGTDPIADPGSKTGGRAIPSDRDRPFSQSTSGIGTKALNPSGLGPEHWTAREHARPGDRLPAVRNSNGPVLHFRLNQYRTSSIDRSVYSLDGPGRGSYNGYCVQDASGPRKELKPIWSEKRDL